MLAGEAKRIARERREARGSARLQGIQDAREGIEAAARDGVDLTTVRIDPAQGVNAQAVANQIRAVLEQEGYEVAIQMSGDVAFVHITWANATEDGGGGGNGNGNGGGGAQAVGKGAGKSG
jgi:hypothetical protein